MGNDLLIATLAIEHGKEPDWEATFAHVRDMTRGQIWGLAGQFVNWLGEVPQNSDGEVDVEECRERMKNLVGDVQTAATSGHRHLYESEYVVPGWTVWITGGDSWGDSPTEEFDLFNAFHELGLSERAGFACYFPRYEPATNGADAADEKFLRKFGPDTGN